MPGLASNEGGTGISGYRIDRYRPGDEDEILDLFAATFGERRSMALWRWRYGELPGATEHILVARDEGGAIRGHYAALPFTIHYRGRRVPGALRLDFMVHPDHQGRGIGSLLVETLRQNAVPHFSLIFGFANRRSTPIGHRISPQYLAEVPIYWRLEDLGAPLAALGRREKTPPALIACANMIMKALYGAIEASARLGRRYRVEYMGGFAEAPPETTDHHREGCGIYVQRDEAFLRWRFDRHPEAEYHILILIDVKDRDAPAGYAVLTVRDYQGFRIGFVVDILVQPAALPAARFLLLQALRWFRARGVEAVSCLMTGSNVYTRALKSLGFLRAPRRFLPRDLNLMLRVPDPRRADRDYATDPDNWILTWADTDLV